MSKGMIDFWVRLAWVMAVISVVSAVTLCLSFGTTHVPTGYGYEMRRVVNWPLIVGMASTVIYTVLFAACLSVVRISALNSRTALELLLAREEGGHSDADRDSAHL